MIGLYLIWPRNPDLTITSVSHSPSDPTSNDMIDFLIEVQNIGAGSSDPSTLLFKVNDEADPHSISVPSLSPDQSYTLQYQIQLPEVKEYTITLTLDDENMVRESNEENNEETHQVNVKTPFIPREEAAEIVIDTIAEASAAPMGMKVYSYPELLTSGTRIESYYSWVEEKEDVVICENDCWFFWIDDDPYAQFAHKTRFVIIDAYSKEVLITEFEWWPVIDGNVIWGTTEERRISADIIYEVTIDLELVLDWKHYFPTQTNSLCELWSIIVCGSNDPGNTFDEDTDYIYNVVKGLGYSDSHIFYLSPFTSDPGVDRVTNLTNVQWAFNQVAANSDSTDKVFIFYSAHGGIDSLQCNPGAVGGGHVSSTNMDNWIDNITADDIIVLLQGCHTGSFIGAYSDGSVVTSENELTGDGETNRIVMTATDTTHSSYGGSSSWGSTFTGGYVASFSENSADVDQNGDTSVDEAYDYAWDHDSARISGLSFPQRVTTSLNPSHTYHTCIEDITIGIIIDTLYHIPEILPIIEYAEHDINDYCNLMNIPYNFEFLIETCDGQSAIALEKIQSFKSLDIKLIITYKMMNSAFSAISSYVNENDMLLLHVSSAQPFLSLEYQFYPTCDIYQARAIAEMLWSYGIQACVVIQKSDASTDGLYNIFQTEYEAKGGVIIERIRLPGEPIESSSLLLAASDSFLDASEHYGSEHVGVQTLCLNLDSIRAQLEDYPPLSEDFFFGSDINAFSWFKASPYLTPPKSEHFDDLYNILYSDTGTRMGYFDALPYDACWLLALSVIDSDSTTAEQVELTLPGVAETYFNNYGWCDLYTSDRASADYDIWGQGTAAGAISSIRYGFYDGTLGEVTWFTNGVSYYGVVTGGMFSP